MASVKPELPPLRTPLTAAFAGSYPSELRSPAVGTPTYIKREESMKTPISPPAAYLDFLTKFSPIVASPLSANGKTRFTWDKPPLTTTASSESVVSDCSVSSGDSFSSAASAASAASGISVTSNVSAATAASVATVETIDSASETTSRPASPRSQASPRPQPSPRPVNDTQPAKRVDIAPINIAKAQAPYVVRKQAPYTAGAIPSSPFTRSQLSARTPRRLHIPQSPSGRTTIRSPLSANSIYSPWSAVLSPDAENNLAAPLSANPSRSVSIRQVVTRTVTYAQRAPAAPIVDAVPASKRRKTDA